MSQATPTDRTALLRDAMTLRFSELFSDARFDQIARAFAEPAFQSAFLQHLESRAEVCEISVPLFIRQKNQAAEPKFEIRFRPGTSLEDPDDDNTPEHFDSMTTLTYYLFRETSHLDLRLKILERLVAVTRDGVSVFPDAQSRGRVTEELFEAIIRESHRSKQSIEKTLGHAADGFFVTCQRLLQTGEMFASITARSTASAELIKELTSERAHSFSSNLRKEAYEYFWPLAGDPGVFLEPIATTASDVAAKTLLTFELRLFELARKMGFLSSSRAKDEAAEALEAVYTTDHIRLIKEHALEQDVLDQIQFSEARSWSGEASRCRSFCKQLEEKFYADETQLTFRAVLNKLSLGELSFTHLTAPDFCRQIVDLDDVVDDRDIVEFCRRIRDQKKLTTAFLHATASNIISACPTAEAVQFFFEKAALSSGTAQSLAQWRSQQLSDFSNQPIERFSAYFQSLSAHCDGFYGFRKFSISGSITPDALDATQFLKEKLGYLIHLLTTNLQQLSAEFQETKLVKFTETRSSLQALLKPYIARFDVDDLVQAACQESAMPLSILNCLQRRLEDSNAPQVNELLALGFSRLLAASNSRLKDRPAARLENLAQLCASQTLWPAFDNWIEQARVDLTNFPEIVTQDILRAHSRYSSAEDQLFSKKNIEHVRLRRLRCELASRFEFSGIGGYDPFINRPKISVSTMLAFFADLNKLESTQPTLLQSLQEFSPDKKIPFATIQSMLSTPLFRKAEIQKKARPRKPVSRL